MSQHSENDNSVVVTSHQMMPRINRLLERLSGVQWSLTESGACDSGVRAELTGMISNILAFSLMMRLIRKSKTETKHFFASAASSAKEQVAILKRLRDLMQAELSSTESATSLMNDEEKFIKKMAKCLTKEFGSPDNVLKAAMANDASFDEALIKHLRMHLGVIPSPTKKSKISRFFSALGENLQKFFRLFTEARDEYTYLLYIFLDDLGFEDEDED